MEQSQTITIKHSIKLANQNQAFDQVTQSKSSIRSFNHAFSSTNHSLNHSINQSIKSD
jgi:hypothetical protein